MRTVVLFGQNDLRIVERPIPAVGEGEILLRVAVCGVCGTDIHKIRHGEISSPVVLGHEVAGVVEKVGPGVERFGVGDRVVVAHHVPCMKCHYCKRKSYSMCRFFKETGLEPGGFSEYLRVPKEHVLSTAFPIPGEVSLEEASFMEPLACCLRAIKRSTIQSGDTVVVLGLGPMGLLMLQLVRSFQGTALGLDSDPARVALAKTMGFEAFEHSDEIFRRTLDRTTENRGSDAVIVTAGTPSLAPSFFSWLRDGGTLAIFSGFFPEHQVELDWNLLYHREITVISSYSPSPQDLKEALEMIAKKTISVTPFVQEQFGLEELSGALELLKERKILKALINPALKSGASPEITGSIAGGMK